jgi:hypothetical protein
MLRNLFVTMIAALALMLAVSATSVAAPNPSGSGQPSQECGAVTPAGFQSGGFANAETQYAGSGSGSVDHAGSSQAVSQYDVACYQLSQR